MNNPKNRSEFKRRYDEITAHPSAEELYNSVVSGKYDDIVRSSAILLMDAIKSQVDASCAITNEAATDQVRSREVEKMMLDINMVLESAQDMILDILGDGKDPRVINNTVSIKAPAMVMLTIVKMASMMKMCAELRMNMLCDEICSAAKECGMPVMVVDTVITSTIPGKSQEQK